VGADNFNVRPMNAFLRFFPVSYAGIILAAFLFAAFRREVLLAGVELILVVTFFMLAKRIRDAGRISRTLTGIACVPFLVGFIAVLFVDDVPRIDVSRVALRIDTLVVDSLLLLYPALGFLALAIFYKPATLVPNQSSDPAFSSGTSRAGHEPRHR
jgi:hypothetical protein